MNKRDRVGSPLKQRKPSPKKQSPQKQVQDVKKVDVKKAIKIMEQQQKQFIQQLEQYHEPTKITTTEYNQQKSLLQKLIQTPSLNRPKKILKQLKAQLSYLHCFQIKPKNEQQVHKEMLSLMKRDNDMFRAVISKFIYGKVYQKGSVVDLVGKKRSAVKILLSGQIHVFEPINYQAFKNSSLNIGKVNLSWLNKIIHRVFNPDSQQQMVHFDSFSSINPPSSQLVNPQQDILKLQYHLQSPKPLAPDLLQTLLQTSNIITKRTPNRKTKHLKKQGQLITCQKQEFILKQSQVYQYTAICSTECYVLEIQYQIYKNLIRLLSSDQEKKIIEVLLDKFQMLEYFDAKEFVKKEFIITKGVMEKRREQQANISSPSSPRSPKSPLSSPIIPYQVQLDSFLSPTPHPQPNSQPSPHTQLQSYELPFQDLYLIISGEVSLRISKTTQIKASLAEHSSSKLHHQTKDILKLFKGDIFGLQQIGKIKQYKLRFNVRKDSILLLISEDVYVKMFYEVAGFKQKFKMYQKQRNKIVKDIIKKLNVVSQQAIYNRYQNISHLLVKEDSGVKKEVARVIKNVQYYGKQEFFKIEKRVTNKLMKDKEGKQADKGFKEISQQEPLLRVSLSFASIYNRKLPQNATIKNGYIQIRDSKGLLKRRRSMNIQTKQTQNQILRKIGVITDQQRNKHNQKIINNRKSKYQLEDPLKEKKQFDRLKQMQYSLPKLKHYYAKKQDIEYRNIHKNDL